MGYTHYWAVNEAIPDTAWRDLKKDVERLFASSPCPLTKHSETNEPPLFDDAFIQFNGVPPHDYEDFLFMRRTGSEFCKTGMHPYDTVVCAALAVLADRLPQVTVTSDGDCDDWAPGLAWAAGVLGRPIPCPLPKGG